MRKERAGVEEIALATGSASESGSTVVLARPARLPLALPTLRIAQRPLAAWLGLGVLFVGTVAIVIFAAARPSVLVPRSLNIYPDWEAGPLHGIFGHLPHRQRVVNPGFSALIVLMLLAYLVVLQAARSLSMRAIAGFVVAVSVVLVLGPPLQFTDLFNYLAYARLGALHHLNPYTHVIAAESFDPVSRFVTWSNWHSPYGALFSAVTYPLAWMSLPAAYWTLKVVTVLMGLVFVWLVYKCARLLDRDPRLPVLLVAANPVFLIYAVGEFHNDFFMLVPSMASIALLLARRYRWAGVVAAVAIAVKYTMVLLVPFLLLAAWRQRATRRLLSGLVIGGIPMLALSIVLFGLTFPNVNGQSRLVTDLSIPNMLGWALGLGGATPGLVSALNVVVVAVVGYQLFKRRDWLTGAGWATLALLATLGWLMPWYIIWLLPLAAIAPNARLRGVAVGATAFVILTLMPVTIPFLKSHGINPLGSPVGNAAHEFQRDAQRPPGLVPAPPQ